MPTIKTLKQANKERPKFQDGKDKNKSRHENYKARQKVYQSAQWKDLRESILRQSPLCACCQAMGKTQAAECVHHRISFVGLPPEQINEVAFDPDNLQSLCITCHGILHSHPMFKGRRDKNGIELGEYMAQRPEEYDIYRQIHGEFND